MKAFLKKKLLELMAEVNPKNTDYKKVFRPYSHRFYTKKGTGHDARPNIAKQRTKPCNPGMPRRFGEVARGATPAPTIDQVRHLEERIGLRIKVKLGICHAGMSGFIVPINATLDEADQFLDEHMALIR